MSVLSKLSMGASAVPLAVLVWFISNRGPSTLGPSLQASSRSQQEAAPVPTHESPADASGSAAIPTTSPRRASDRERSPSGSRIAQQRLMGPGLEGELEPSQSSAVESGAHPIVRIPNVTEGNPSSAKDLLLYMKDVVNEQYTPLARGCIEQLRERKPDVQGKLVLKTTISGSAEVGGLVEQVEVAEGASLQDEEFTQCVQQSLYTLELDPPPKDNESVTLDFPIVLHPPSDTPPDPNATN